MAETILFRTSGLNLQARIGGQWRSVDGVRYERTSSEIAAAAEVVNFAYEPGNVLRYGDNVVPGTTDMSAAVQTACDVYLNDETISFVYLQGAIYCASDVPDIHRVQLRGPGYVKIGTGRPWWAEPDETNTTFSAPMTLYLSSSGSDDNSGLSTAFPLLTLQKAADILDLYKGPLIGFWRIIAAAGTYTGRGDFIGLQNTYENPLYISGPSVSAWDNSSPPASKGATGGSIPTAIFQGIGAGNGGYAISARRHSYIFVENIKFNDYGTKATDNDEGAIEFRDWSGGRTTNCHVWDCTNGVTVRESSTLQVEGGYINGCKRGSFAIFARYTLAFNASSAGDTKAPMIEGCTFGFDVFEGGNGHCDFVRFKDNDTHVYLRRGSHSVVSRNTFERTTGTVQGVEARDGAVAVISNPDDNVWVGTHTPRIRLRNGGFNTGEDNGNVWRVVAFATSDSAVSGTTNETTVATYTMPAGHFVFIPARLRIKLVCEFNSPNDIVTIRVRAGGALISSCTVPLNAAVMHVVMDFELLVYSAGQKFTMNTRQFNEIGTVNVRDDDHGGASIDFASADQSITVSLQCANAGDTATMKHCTFERLG